jgi:hypothetical protein
MPDRKDGFSSLPFWPEDARELQGTEPSERYYWFYAAPLIAVAIGLFRAALWADDFGKAIGMALGSLVPGLLVGCVMDRSSWIRNRRHPRV